MRYFELNKNEEKTLKEFEAGKFKRVRNAKREVSRYKQYAKGTLQKAKNINIRLSNRDLQKIKAMAVEKGIPYQTLISSVLHQYSNGKVNGSSR